jgi:hypothetical protein
MKSSASTEVLLGTNLDNGGLKQHETEHHGSKRDMRTVANASVFTGRFAG